MDQLDVLKPILFMENEENVVADNLNTAEEEVLETSEESEFDSSELENRLAKAEELANNYKVRAEKAEKLAKSVKIEQPKAVVKAGDLSSKDIYALMESKVPEEDIDEVAEFAKFKGISIKEALSSNTVKSILSEKAEMRNVASASNVGSSKRGSGKMSDESLMSKASKGELPDNEEDMIRLIKARRGMK